MSNLSPQQTWIQLKKWYATDIGMSLYEYEIKQVQRYLEGCFGFNAIQLGCITTETFNHSRINQTLIVDCYLDKNLIVKNHNNIKNPRMAISLFELLSLQTNSVDVVVLFHSLDFSNEPHAILREVERILVPEGKLIIVGFNPFSLFGIWRFSLRIQQKVKQKMNTSSTVSSMTASQIDSELPSQTELISLTKIQDWVSLLGFTCLKKSSVFFRPPISHKKVLDRLVFMEQTGKRFWPFFSASYVLLSIKRVSTLTPIKNKWVFKKAISGKVTTESSIAKGSTSQQNFLYKQKFNDQNE